MNKKWWLLTFLIVIVAIVIGYKMMTKIPEVKVFEMKEVDRLPVGRASIGVFEKYNVVGSGATYDGLILRGDDALSETSFLEWVNRRWKDIQKVDVKKGVDHQPIIYRPSPHKVSFKYGYDEIDLKGYEGSYYEGEGAVWMNNKVLYIAPGGSIDADKRVIEIIKNVREFKDKEDKNFCLGFYCLDLPASNNESASINIKFPNINGLHFFIRIERYNSEQNEFYSKRTLIGEIPGGHRALGALSGTVYAHPSRRKVDGIEGEQDIGGASEKLSENKYNNFIQARWYYPGTSGDPDDPEIEISLVYETELDHKPSRSGWFDDETVKQTGFTPEKFMSMWEATLKSFKRQR